MHSRVTTLTHNKDGRVTIARRRPRPVARPPSTSFPSFGYVQVGRGPNFGRPPEQKFPWIFGRSPNCSRCETVEVRGSTVNAVFSPCHYHNHLFLQCILSINTSLRWARGRPPWPITLMINWLISNVSHFISLQLKSSNSGTLWLLLIIFSNLSKVYSTNYLCSSLVKFFVFVGHMQLLFFEFLY